MKVLLKRLVSIIILLLLVFFIVQSTVLPGMVERAVHHALKDAGLTIHTLNMRSVSWSRADFVKLLISGRLQITIDSLQTDYDMASILRGRVKTVRITGAQFTYSMNGEKATLAPSGDLLLNPPPNQAEIPLDLLEFSSCAITLVEGKSRLHVPLDGWIKNTHSSLEFLVQSELLGGSISLAGNAKPNAKLINLHVKAKGLHPELLPRPFVPSPFTTHPQGVLHGQWHFLWKTNGVITAESDMNFRLSGAINDQSFQLEQARLKTEMILNAEKIITAFHADLGVEQAVIGQYAVKNLSILATNRQNALSANITGMGKYWSFRHARIDLSNFNTLFQAILRPWPSTPQILSDIKINIKNFHNSSSKTRISFEHMRLDSTIEQNISGIHLGRSELHINSGHLTRGNVHINGIEGQLVLEEFFPLAIRGTQSFQIEQAQFGDIVLNKGQVQFMSLRPHVFRIERADWDWCGGRVSCRPFDVSLKEPVTTFTAFFEDISLQRLLTTLWPEQISGDGHLYGRIPIRLRLSPDMELTYGKGYLYAIPSRGTLNVSDKSIVGKILLDTSSQKQQDSSSSLSRPDKVNQAMKKFHYDMLKFTFERRHVNGLSGDMQVQGEGPFPNPIRFGMNIPFSVR